MGRKQIFRKSLSKARATQTPVPADAVDAIQKDNRRYRDLIDFLPLSVFEIDRHAKVIFANRHAMKDSGYTTEELMGMPAINFFISEDKGRIKENIGKIFNGEKLSGNEYTVLRKNGSTFPAVIYSSPTIHDGQIVGITGIFVDISDRKIAEKALRESEAKYRTLLVNLPQKIFQKDINSVFISCNENFARELKLDPAEIKGKTDYDFYSKELADKFRAHDKKIFESGKTEILEWVHIGQDKKQWSHAVKTPIKDENNNITGVLGIFWDITERKRAEEALKESETHLRTLIRTIPDLVWLKDQQGIYLSCNSRFESFFGAKEKDIIGKTDYDFVDKELADFFRKHDKVAMAKGKPSRNEEEVTFADDGHRELLETIKTPMYRSDGQLAGVLGIGRDITEKKQVSEQIRSLSHALLTTQESERLMISRELHDSLAQDLVVAKLHCDITLNRSLSGQLIPEKSLKKTSDILNKCISAVRRLAYDLRPSDLIQFGIVETLNKHCIDFSETHMIPVDFQAGGFEKITISDELSINIFRLVQEGLNNIMKHAAASQVLIRVFAAFPHIILRIEDNGKGFDVRKRQASITEEKKLGLRGMQERVDLLGGDMKIDSKPGSGTKLFIKILYGEETYGLEKNHIDR